jgi:large subunit ribosomal protein L35
MDIRIRLVAFLSDWARRSGQGNAMPKLKTHKGVAKRVKVTKRGKIKRHQAFHGHLMAGKSGSRRRRLKGPVTANKQVARRLARLLGLR